ncbi:hypothetical protein J6590_063377 [Homalodisca vitripennis]|nr:hypothetical protein J6590_063377 [Homalodisca vitripennis]
MSAYDSVLLLSDRLWLSKSGAIMICNRIGAIYPWHQWMLGSQVRNINLNLCKNLCSRTDAALPLTVMSFGTTIRAANVRSIS